MVVSCDIDHDAAVCAVCGATLGAARRCRQDSAHYVYDLERTAMALQISAARHRYFVGRCACGHETIARPGVGRCSEIEGRRRNLQLTERCLVGPALASFIAILSLRFRLSRQKIQEFLADWLGLELGTASIDRCIREFGLACEPVVEDLVAEIRSAEIVHLDETPWYQRGVFPRFRKGKVMAVGGGERHRGGVPYRQPREGGTDRTDRRGLPPPSQGQAWAGW